MLNVHDKYRFYYNHPLDGWTQCFPAIPSIEWTWNREEGQIFFRKELSTDMTFVNDPDRGIDDFTRLYNIDRSDFRCNKIFFKVERKCGEVWNDFWEGYLALVDGDFDVDKCRLDIPVRADDKYTCIFENWEKEVNILEAEPIEGDSFTVVTTVAHTDFSRVYDVPVPKVFDPNFAVIDLSFVFDVGWTRVGMENQHLWSLIDNKVHWVDTGFNSYTFEITSIWQSYQKTTEIVDGQPLPAGGGYELIDPEHEIDGEIYGLWQKPAELPQTMPDHGRFFNEVVQMLLDECNLQLQSYFFGTGGVGDKPNNGAYDFAESNMHNLRIYQITDIKKSTASQSATIGELSLRDLLEDLSELNIFWDIDENGNFILEHVSYFINKKSRMLNLLKPEVKKFIRGKHRYSYFTELLPRLEEFKWPYEGEREFSYPAIFAEINPLIISYLNPIEKSYSKLAFDAGVIEYPRQCSNEDENVQHDFSNFTTNLADVMEFPDNYPNRMFVIVAANSNNEIITYQTHPGEETNPVIRTSRLRVNAPLTLVELIHNLMRHRRPHSRGNLVDLDIVLEMISVLPTRKQDELSAPICCEDIDIFDPQDLVKSQLGWGEVEEAVLNDPGSILTINLRHG